MQQIIMTNPQDAYRRQGVLTASPIELIVMLYDGLKKNLVLGKRAIDKNDPAGAHKYLMKSQDIVTELINCLDLNYDISNELMEIYEFILSCLEEVNMTKESALIDPVIEMVDSLRDTWKEVSSMQKSGTMQLDEAQ